jgi:hypothetical protein
MEENQNKEIKKGASHKSWLFFSKTAASKVSTTAYTVLIIIGVAILITIIVLGSLGLLPKIG